MTETADDLSTPLGQKTARTQRRYRLPFTGIQALAAVLGLFLGLGNFALLAACASAGKASIVIPLTALYPAVSVPIAILFLGEKVGTRESVGILLALASVIALSHESPPAPENSLSPH